MTYLFGTNTFINRHTAPVPQYEVDSDGVNITVTHCKSGILSDMVSLDAIKEQCHGPFEEVSHFILRHITGANGNGAIDNKLVVNFTDRAQSAISNIAHFNRYNFSCCKVGKF